MEIVRAYTAAVIVDTNVRISKTDMSRGSLVDSAKTADASGPDITAEPVDDVLKMVRLGKACVLQF